MKSAKKGMKNRTKKLKKILNSKKSFNYLKNKSRLRRLYLSYKMYAGKKKHLRKMMKGGSALAPNYPAGYLQYNNNNGSLSNSFSTGGPLSPNSSALASPPPITVLQNGVDNLNHNALNSYGNSGAGSGFPSRGWF